MLVLKKNRTQRGKGDTPSKRGSSLRNYLDQTQSNEFGQKEDIGIKRGSVQLVQVQYVPRVLVLYGVRSS